MSTLALDARQALDAGRLALPELGGGRSPERWAGLVDLAEHDVDLARLGEAHVDAVQILAEAGRAARPGCLLGVWAAEHPAATVTARREPGSGRFALDGSKAFCSGAGIVDAALVTAATPDGPLLLEVPMAALDHGRIDSSGWKVRALRRVQTATVDLSGVVLPPDAQVGGPGWYLDRPGFWDGAIGPAACWAGAAIGLVDVAIARAGDDPHARAHVGALSAGARALRSILDAAGREQDAGLAVAAVAQRRALEVRHVVDTWCADIEERFSRCLGPRALAFDEALADRLQALSIYRRQCHGERDLAVLGALAAAHTRPDAEPPAVR